MSISLIYHVNSNIKTLKKSLSSIFEQSSKDFELVFIDDNATPEVESIIEEFNVFKLKNSVYVNTNQKFGHSFSFNLGLDNAHGEFVYYLGSNIILNKDFIKNINKVINKNKDADMIVLSMQSNKSNDVIVYDKVDKEFAKKFKPTIRDKVFNTEFLKKNNIKFDTFQYYPLVHLYKCLDKLHKSIFIPEKLIDFFQNKNYTYNLYDTFEQANILMNNKDEYSFLKNNKENQEIYEFMIIYSILYTFLRKIDAMYSSNSSVLFPSKIVGRALHTSNVWLTENIPNWRENRILKDNVLELPKKISDYLKCFKFKVAYIHHAFK